jgi:hypothetical protein
MSFLRKTYIVKVLANGVSVPRRGLMSFLQHADGDGDRNPDERFSPPKGIDVISTLSSGGRTMPKALSLMSFSPPKGIDVISTLMTLVLCVVLFEFQSPEGD